LKTTAMNLNFNFFKDNEERIRHYRHTDSKHHDCYTTRSKKSH
jgi:hypothetical protein